MTERQGLDTALAALLHRRGRVDLLTLQRLLFQARRQRSQGQTLAGLLVGNGVLPEVEACAYLGQIGPGGQPDLASSLAGSSPDAAPSIFDEETRRLSVSGEDVPAGQRGSQVVAPATPAPAPIRRDDPTLPGGRGGAAGLRPRRRPDVWEPGLQLGPYELGEELGRGGMAVLFRARHVQTGVPYAIKAPVAQADAELLTRFRREGELQARVDAHPHVVRVHTLDEHEGRPYLVMELVEAGDLAGRIRHGPLPVEEAARLGRHVALGLAHLHAQGILHRDLKPSNVLIAHDGAAKLADFGLARLLGADSLTRTGELLGTPAYMAPEQALGLKDQLGPGTDVFALGAVLYAALSGRDAFAGENAASILLRVLGDDPAPLDEVPLELQSLVERCLDKAVEDRPTAAEVAAELGAWLGEEPAGLPDPAKRRLRVSTVTQLRRRRRRLWLALPALAGLGLALATRSPEPGSGDAAVSPTPSPRRTRPAPTAPSPSPTPAASPDEASRPRAWSWEAGQEVRWQLDVSVDMPGLDGVFFRYDLTARAVATGPEAVYLEARLDALVVRWQVDAAVVEELRAAGRDVTALAEGMDYDSSRGAAEHPFDRALGPTFRFRLDPRTGDVGQVDGVAAIASDRVLRGVPEAERARYRLPLLESGGDFERNLEAVLRFLPGAEPLPRAPWTIARPEQPRARGDPLPGVLLRVTPSEESGGGLVLHVLGSEEEGSWRGRVEGEVRFRGGRLEAAEVEEAWEPLTPRPRQGDSAFTSKIALRALE